MGFKFRVFFPWESDFEEEGVGLPDQDVWRPPADVMETEEFFFIRMELPGLEREDVEISVTGERLQIKGERRFEKKTSHFKVVRSEIPYGFFLRTFKLPKDIKIEEIEAKLVKGILTVKIPKRKIDIRIDGE